MSSSGGYAGGLDADASFHAKGETSSSSSDVTMAELRNRSRGPSSQSAPRRTVPPTSSQPPPPSSLPPPDPFSSQSRAPPNGILSGRGELAYCVSEIRFLLVLLSYCISTEPLFLTSFLPVSNAWDNTLERIHPMLPILSKAKIYWSNFFPYSFCSGENEKKV